MHREKTSHEVEGTTCKAQRQDCVEAQIWGRLQKKSAALKVLKSTLASIILKWKKRRLWLSGRAVVFQSEDQQFEVSLGKILNPELLLMIVRAPCVVACCQCMSVCVNGCMSCTLLSALDKSAI